MQTVSLLKATLESTTDGILVVDRAGKITSYNERFIQLWQVPREVLATGQDETVIQTVLGQLSDPEAFLAKVQELYQNPLAESVDLLKFKDGRIFERSSKPQLIAGEPVGRVWSFFDDTERRRAEASVKETERRLRIVIEATMDVIFLKDGAGRWQLINHAAIKLFALEAVDYQGKTDLELAELVPQRHAELVNCTQSDLQAWTNRQPTRSEEFISAEDGQLHCIDVIKVPIFNEDGSRLSLVVVGRDITERKRTEQELFKSRETLKMVLNNVPQRVYWKSRDLVFEGCNLPFARDCGLADPAEVIGKTDFELTNAADAEKYRALDREVMERDQPKLNFEMTDTRLDGRPAYLLVSKLPLHDQEGRVIGVLGAFDDITARKLLEVELRQAQKMEAIGRLAGGIAHDFNNLLTVICGYSEILLHELPPEDTSRDALMEIRKAGERAASLTRKLLAFSRKQVLEPDVLDLNALVGDCENMFQRLLGEDIVLTVKLAPDLGKIKADASQIDQVLLNLVVNSRDAMPRGGELVIETANAVLTEADRRQNGDIVPGNYVSLSVGDTGCGMDKTTISHIFEPFFTTKEQGKGTGLGLAMVFGFIKQSGGHITVESDLDRGCVFRIYLPKFDEPPE
jgi:PAS domain S-box-containing protein